MIAGFLVRSLWLLLLCLWSSKRCTVDGFTYILNKSRLTGRIQVPLYAVESDKDAHPMSSYSFLSHAMLKVPSVDVTAAYWTSKGGKIRVSTPKDDGASNGESQLRSAFVELGCSSGSKKDASESEARSEQPPVCFALELVSTDKSKYQLGNEISYLGVSMLMQFQNNLLGAITGEEKPQSQGEEPNGIPVTSSASAPGDFLARFALRSADLESTFDFYTSILGMDCKGQDEAMVCLRYDNDCFKSGVPTTLLFEKSTEEIVHGDCLDHFAITTKTNINDLYQSSKRAGCKIFMKPTKMFGKEVMGLIDPNGYKVVVASTQQK